MSVSVCSVSLQFNRGQVSLFDLNVMPVWQKNITGRGVVLSIIDDGEYMLSLPLVFSYKLESGAAWLTPHFPILEGASEHAHNLTFSSTQNKVNIIRGFQII